MHPKDTIPVKQFHTCRRCFTTKPITEFRLRDGGKYPESFCKPCKADQRREWRAKNREHNREVDRAWREKNRDKVMATQRRYRERHAEEIRRRDRERYWANRDRLVKYQREWRKKVGRRRINGYMKTWKKKHPHIYRSHKTRDAQRRRAAGPLFSALEWRSLVAKYNHQCLWCGRSEPDIRLTADHIVPVTKGGTNDIENIQPLCRSCNSKKRVRIIDFRAKAHDQLSLLPHLEQREDR